MITFEGGYTSGVGNAQEGALPAAWAHPHPKENAQSEAWERLRNTSNIYYFTVRPTHDGRLVSFFPAVLRGVGGM